MKIDKERLKARMDAINGIAVTEEDGMMRLALSDADKTARDMLCGWMKEAGMEIKVDDMGTIYGTMPGSEPDALPICIGSHMDTQPNGGRYDGFFGVMAALEAVCTLKDNGIVTKSPLTVIDWTNEEGARFVPPMLASGVAAGLFEGEWVLDKLDKDGLRYGDELERIGYAGAAENRLQAVKYYLEPHIEQGPVLDAEGYEFGIVTGALGITGLDVTIRGEANHAGTTPMSHRKDALTAAAEAILKIRRLTLEFGEPAVITVGIINALPASKNIVPGEVYFSVDMRYHTDEGLTELERRVRETIAAVCAECGTEAQIERYWRADPVSFNETVVAAVEETAQEMSLKAKRIISGAGHDAVFISEVFPTGMLFVPSIGGMSHCPQENTKWEDIVTGAEAVTEIILKLDE